MLEIDMNLIDESVKKRAIRSADAGHRIRSNRKAYALRPLLTVSPEASAAYVEALLAQLAEEARNEEPSED